MFHCAQVILVHLNCSRLIFSFPIRHCMGRISIVKELWNIKYTNIHGTLIFVSNVNKNQWANSTRMHTPKRVCIHKKLSSKMVFISICEFNFIQPFGGRNPLRFLIRNALVQSFSFFLLFTCAKSPSASCPLFSFGDLKYKTNSKWEQKKRENIHLILRFYGFPLEAITNDLLCHAMHFCISH